MKKEIKVFVHACDKCKRHGMELRTCIGCGITLCGFCSDRHGGKYSRTIRNKLGCGCYGFREFYDFKFDLEKIYFCMDCLSNPTKCGVSALLNLCIKKEKDCYEYTLASKKYEERKVITLDKAWSLIYNQEEKLRKRNITLPNNEYEEIKE